MRHQHLVVVIAFIITIPATANVVEYSNRNLWLTAAGTYTQITFQGYGNNTIITNQYSNLGVTFTDGTDRIFFSPNAFPNDGVGLYGAVDTIDLSFDASMYTIAVDYPGSIQVKLFWHGALTYTSTPGVHVGAGFFKGLISDQPFDAVIILDPLGDVNIDDLYFGGQAPCPGALAMLAASAIVSRRRRLERP